MGPVAGMAGRGASSLATKVDRYEFQVGAVGRGAKVSSAALDGLGRSAQRLSHPWHREPGGVQVVISQDLDNRGTTFLLHGQRALGREQTVAKRITKPFFLKLEMQVRFEKSGVRLRTSPNGAFRLEVDPIERDSAGRMGRVQCFGYTKGLPADRLGTQAWEELRKMPNRTFPPGTEQLVKEAFSHLA